MILGRVMQAHVMAWQALLDGQQVAASRAEAEMAAHRAASAARCEEVRVWNAEEGGLGAKRVSLEWL